MADKDNELAQYLYIILRRKWVLLAAFAAVTGLGYFYTARQTPVYRATVSILIEREPPRVLEAKEVLPLGEERDYDNYYNTQLKILESRNIAVKALERLEDPARVFPPPGENGPGALPARAPADPARYAGRLLSLLRVEPVRNSRLVRLNVDHTDPAAAALVANTVADVFVEENLQRRLRASGEAQVWLLRQVDGAEAKLQAAEAALADYRRRSGQISLDQSQDIVTTRLKELNSAYTAAQDERIAAEAAYGHFREQAREITASTPEMADSPLVQGLKRDLLDRENEYRRLSDRYTPAHPDMVRVGAQIEDLRARIAAETEREAARIARERARESADEVARLTRQYRLAYEAALKRENEIAQLLRGQEAAALRLTDQLVEFNVLRREVDTRRELYQMLLNQAQEVDLTGDIRANNISVLDPAEVPRAPVSPRTTQNMAVSALLGLVLGAGLVFFTDYLDDHLRSFDDIRERTGENTPRLLSTVPHVRLSDRAIPLETVTGKKGTHPHATNAFRMLRTNLLFPDPENPLKTVLVTSSIGGEGKTFVTCNLAIAFAQIGARVLVVDSDMHKPQLGKIFDVRDSKGLSDYLAGDVALEAAVHPSGQENLSVLPGGQVSLDSEQLISSGAMLTLGPLLKEKFDYVFFDSPPLMLMPDASFLNARVADATIVVARAGKTPGRVFERAVQMLREARGAVLAGVVFNDISRASGPSYYKYEYYDYDYGEKSPR